MHSLGSLSTQRLVFPFIVAAFLLMAVAQAIAEPPKSVDASTTAPVVADRSKSVDTSAAVAPVVAERSKSADAVAAAPVVTESSKSVDPIAEIHRLEKKFLKAQYDTLQFYINLSIAAIAVVFSILAFFGLKGIYDAKDRLEDAKKTMNNLAKEAQEHLETIKQIREQTSAWSTDIETATDDITGLRQQLGELADTIVKIDPEYQQKQPGVTLDRARELMLNALTNGPYRWRSIERIAAISGVSVEDATSILRSLPDEVVFSRGKSGRTIVRLKSRTS